MADPPTQQVTQVLRRVASGQASAAGELLPLVYGELRRLAQSHLRQQSSGRTLQATALVHEVYLRLVGSAESLAERISEYAVAGIETFILSGYPHLEEAYRVAELLFPLLPIARDTSEAVKVALGRAGEADGYALARGDGAFPTGPS